MSWINFNGNIITAGTPIATAQDRGLRYGDGLFETLLFNRSALQLWQLHTERLWKGMSVFGFDIPPGFTKEYLEEQAIALAIKNNHSRAVIRINIIAASGGTFDTEKRTFHFIIESRPLERSFELNSTGLQLCFYKEAIKPCDSFSNLKHNNYLPYLMAASFAKEQLCSDAVVLNQHGRICETSIANIFLIKNKEIFTPALTEGCIAGTMRAFLLEQLSQMGYQVHETSITLANILQADEVFVSNAILPVKWVSTLQNSHYSNTEILNIYRQLEMILPSYF